MNISIIGTGYVGLITGIGLALRGNKIVCVDVDASIVDRLNSGQATIHEKGLDTALAKAQESKCFRATSDLTEAVLQSDLTIIAVGTPNSEGKIDLRHIEQCATEIGLVLKNKTTYHTVVVKSTVLPSTTDSFVLPILEKSSGKKLGDFGLGFNPEFLREGSAMEDFTSPDRIVLGSDDRKSSESLRNVYAGWEVDILEVNTRTAEMIKYANNSLLATQISVTNEIANLSVAIGGIDSADVMSGVCLDGRWNPCDENGMRVNPGILTYLVPGCGFGGSCFPKDVEALAAKGKELGLSMQMLDSVLEVNRKQPLEVVRLLKQSLGRLQGKKIAVLGLAFKPDTDDVRLSPSLPIIDDLLSKGACVSACDPVAHQNAKAVLDESSISISSQWQDAVKDADAVVVITSWDEYRTLPAEELKSLMKGDIVVDARGVCAHLESSDLFNILRIGYAPVISKTITETEKQVCSNE